jgi:hypothetical protein
MNIRLINLEVVKEKEELQEGWWIVSRPANVQATLKCSRCLLVVGIPRVSLLFSLILRIKSKIIFTTINH